MSKLLVILSTVVMMSGCNPDPDSDFCKGMLERSKARLSSVQKLCPEGTTIKFRIGTHRGCTYFYNLECVPKIDCEEK